MKFFKYISMAILFLSLNSSNAAQVIFEDLLADEGDSDQVVTLEALLQENKSLKRSLQIAEATIEEACERDDTYEALAQELQQTKLAFYKKRDSDADCQVNLESLQGQNDVLQRQVTEQAMQLLSYEKALRELRQQLLSVTDNEAVSDDDATDRADISDSLFGLHMRSQQEELERMALEYDLCKKENIQYQNEVQDLRRKLQDFQDEMDEIKRQQPAPLQVPQAPLVIRGGDDSEIKQLKNKLDYMSTEIADLQEKLLTSQQQEKKLKGYISTATTGAAALYGLFNR